ncbi:MAG: Cof-type HAD-IIB family hydrolase [Defluviitaleaceae bacterium]|nr:Cof-type HAD-IIB family hydrolase [Defluviitaleaceae bacterium]
MYKLIASDVDGTLLAHYLTMHPDNKPAIAKALQKGVLFCLCSGRSYKSLKTIHSMLELPKNGYIIAFNGGVVYDVQSETVIYEEFLGLTLGIEVIKFFKSRPREAEMFVYVDFESVLVEEHTNATDAYSKISEISMKAYDDIVSEAARSGNIIKIIFMAQNSVLQKLKCELDNEFGKVADISFSSEYLLEVGSISCSKGNALQWLCNKLNIDIAHTIAMGDNYNDISMIKTAGLGIAVANAVHDLKFMAGYTTEKTSAEGAVAEAIGKFVL